MVSAAEFAVEFVDCTDNDDALKRGEVIAFPHSYWVGPPTALSMKSQ